MARLEHSMTGKAMTVGEQVCQRQRLAAGYSQIAQIQLARLLEWESKRRSMVAKGKRLPSAAAIDDLRGEIVVVQGRAEMWSASARYLLGVEG